MTRFDIRVRSKQFTQSRIERHKNYQSLLNKHYEQSKRKTRGTMVLVFVLILIFEIIDLAKDDPHLKTVPQQIGVNGTKNLGYTLMGVFCALEVFNLSFRVFMLKVIIALMTTLFLFFVNERRSKYYTSFWTESIPIIWWLLVLFFQK